MCSTRIEQPAEPIRLDLTAAFSFEHGLGRADLLQFGSRLDEARQRLLAEDCEFAPRRLLDDYKTNRHRGLLGQILAAAKQLRELVDRAVILASPAMVRAAQILFAACCHPHHNDLSRGARGGRPRIFFAASMPDNDALQGLLDVLPHGRRLHAIDERWGLVAVDVGGRNFLTGLFGMLWDLLQSTTDTSAESQLAIAVGAAGSPLMKLAEQAQCRRIVAELPTSAVYRENSIWSSAFHPGVLLAASVMGMDVVKLLRGAAMMSERFAIAPPGDNPVLDFAGLHHLLAAQRGIEACKFESHDSALRPLAEAASSNRDSAQHLLVQIFPEALRRDRLRVTMRPDDAAAGDKKRIERRLPDLAASETQSVISVRTAAAQPTAIIRLATIDEARVGQLIELFSLADILQHNFMNLDP